MTKEKQLYDIVHKLLHMLEDCEERDLDEKGRLMLVVADDQYSELCMMIDQLEDSPDAIHGVE